MKIILILLTRAGIVQFLDDMIWKLYQRKWLLSSFYVFELSALHGDDLIYLGPNWLKGN
jgi:hypothetical protein